MSTTPPSPTGRSAASSPNPSSQVPGGNGRRAPGVRADPGAAMTEHIGPLPRLFRGMADRIDQDRLSPTRAEAIGNAAAVAVARAAAEGMVGGRLWDDDGAALLAAADRLPRWTVEAGGPG